MTEEVAKNGFVDLHVHSNYSFRDGVSDIEELVAAAAQIGRPAMALTDHGMGAGFVQLQEACDQAGIGPIFGVDMPVAWPDEAALKETPGEWAGEGCGIEAERVATGGKGGRCHNVVILARDEAGLQNLFRLLTWAGTTGYDGNGGNGPLLNEEILLQNSDGLAVLSGGPSGQVSRLLAAGQPEQAAATAARYREAFGSHFYLELVSSGSNAAQNDRQRLVEFGRQSGLPLLATNDVHYVQPAQATARDLLWAIADNVRLNDPKRRRPVGDDARPLPLDELERRFTELPQALTNAANLAEQCRVRLLKSNLIIPAFPVPVEFADRDGRSAADFYLEGLCRQSLTERYGSTLPEATETVCNTS